METEHAQHETEESLMLAQFGTSGNLQHKLQNGAQSSEKDSLQITEDTNWIKNPAHYKLNKGVSSMKRYRENCNMPASEPGLCKMNGDLTNGELNHTFSEQSLLVHQPKKMKADVEIKENVDTSYDLVNNFSEVESSSQRTDLNFDKRNCHIPNGDIFCLPQNKPVPNGAVSSSSTIESTPGDLLEKTLSQYFPEQVSIAPQTSGSQLDTVNDSLTNQLSGDGAQPLALTSGFPNSSRMSELQQQQSGPSANAEDIDSYNSNYSMNGYSNTYEVDQRQQHHKLQHPPSYSDQELAIGPRPGINPPSNTTSRSYQHPSSGQCIPADTNSQGIFTNAQAGFNPRGYEAFYNSGTQEKQSEVQNVQLVHHRTGKGHQYGSQTQNLQENDGKQHRPNGSAHMEPNHEQPHQTGMENGMEHTPQQRVDISSLTSSQTGWIDRNASHSHQQPSSQAQEQNMWRGFPSKPQSEQQTEGSQVRGQISASNSTQRYSETQTQGVFSDSSQRSNSLQQDCLPTQRQCASIQHHTAPEWQQSNTKTSHIQQTLIQKMSEDKNILQNQHADNCYQSQMEPQHLHEDNDLQEILSAGFVTTQQQHCLLQRPLSHPPQSEEQQLKSPTYRPHSQPPPGQHQLQTDQPLINSSTEPNNRDIHHIDQSTFTYSNTTEMQQPQPLRQHPVNSGNKHLKQFQLQQPDNHCHETNHTDFLQKSTQSQPHLSQGLVNQQVTSQIHLKAEQQVKPSCTQFQTGPRLPLGPAGPQGDFQRHAALRMHLLQRQERHSPHHPTHSSSDLKQNPRGVKMENGPRFELTATRQQDQLLQVREAGMGGVQIKQENQQFLCVQNKTQGSILASMEQSLRQYQLSPVFEKKSVVNSTNKVKVESSGPVTILSTNTDINRVDSLAEASSSVALKKSLDSTPKKEQILKKFIDSPMKLLDTPIKNLLDTPMKTQYEIPSCHCVDQIIEKDEGPYYTHLGSAPNVAGIREMMEKRSGLTGRAIRIEKVIYTGKEGKSTQGCPIAKWVIRRSSVEEKLLVLVRERTGHRCDTACIIVVILVWEGIQPSLADRLYLELSETLTKYGALTQRRCAFNEERTCACQGLNPEACGASFSFGCSWSMYYNGCKFARSKIPRKFKLQGDDVKEEERIERNFQGLASLLAPLYKTMAPEAYGNQVEHEHRAPDCRLGLKEGRPFSGVTACMDFCAHAHRDLHNMQGGSTVVCTLTREDNREIGKIPEDEQLHVLPLYKASNTDEFGSEEGQQEKIKSGAIQVLSAFRRQVRMLAEPAKSCRQKKLDAKKAAANKNAMLESSNDKAEKALQAKSKAGTYENTVQSTQLPGAIGATLPSGHLSFPLGSQPQQIQQQQRQAIFSPYSTPTNAAVTRFSNHPGPFPSTSKPGSMSTPQPPSPASPYLSSFQVQNSYMNGSNRPYPSQQCNGGMPVDNYHPLYASNQKHLDMYQQQRSTLYPEQQYGIHPRFDVNYPLRYNEPGLQVSGYSAMQAAQPMTHYSPYGPSRTSDGQFIDPLSRAPSVHGGAHYTLAVGKGNQFEGYPNPYLPQSPHILPPGQDQFHMQMKTETGIPDSQMLSAQFSSGCLNLPKQSGLGLPNGDGLGSNIKQEPGTPQTPTTLQKPEMWSDNEHNFLDPDIGGVAVAPSHGSVLIECAKRELHATTPLKNPDRNHPTRISLVFYQHKNLNEAKHGLAMWEAKMADKAREKEEEAERNGGEGTPSKGSKKGVKREHSDSSEATGEPPYKRFIKALMEGSSSCTTNTHVITTPYAFTKVTGPYSQFV